jgi:hypothetical protein
MSSSTLDRLRPGPHLIESSGSAPPSKEG